MPDNQIGKSTIRIFDSKFKIVGCGFFFSSSVFTCAHVINQAVGAFSALIEKPTDLIHFDFPLLNPRKSLTGRVTTWLPGDDIARLEVISALPERLTTTKFINASDLWGHSFRAFGFPRGHDEGVWASGRILHKVANGWVEIEDVKQTGFFVQPGFSGGAVWDEQHLGIVGMVAGADASLNSRVAYVIPGENLSLFFPEIAENAFEPIDVDIQIIRELILLDSYNEAYEKCSQVLVNVPTHPVVNLLSVISLLGGKGAEKQNGHNIVKIEKHLKTACESPQLRPTALTLLGIVKYDRYVANGFDEGEPNIDDIKHLVSSFGFANVDRNYLNMIKVSDGALTYLGLDN